MAGKEILYETFFTRAPGQEKLRKTAEGRMRYLLREGWHEVARETVGPDSVRVRFERDGATRPLDPLRKKPEPPPRRRPRDGRGGRGGPGGARPRAGGAPEAGRGTAGGGPAPSGA